MSVARNRRYAQSVTNGSTQSRDDHKQRRPPIDLDLRSIDERFADTEAPTISSSVYSRWGKRLLDIGLSAALLIGLAPLFVVVACLVRVCLGPGGVIFSQCRVGRDGREFTMYKFRTMLPDRRVRSRGFDGPDRRTRHKSDQDPRHRPFGRFLRSTSLDELPQLWNVLVGNMSLVGPRPEIKEIVISDQLVAHPRHRVRPGITGPFQVSDLRFEGRLELGFEMDINYVSDIRLASDCRYLLRTLAAPFMRRGR